MADGYSFKRYEFKYLLDETQYNAVREMLDGKMTVDNYGLTTIANVYYDTDDFRLVRNSIEKPAYKEKLRLRSYGIPDKNTKVFLEIKKKFDGVVYKRRISLSLKDAEAYLSCGIVPGTVDKQRQIFSEIDYFMRFYNPSAKVYIAYDRIALFGNEDNSLRLTFDTNIRSRTDRMSLSKGDSGELLFDEKKYLMEIKVPYAIPLWLADIINKTHAVKTSFSKYGSVYKNGLWKTAPLFTERIRIEKGNRISFTDKHRSPAAV